MELDGQYLEAYSVISWPTDPATSFRALTPPADPQPSAHLAALLTAALLDRVVAGLLLLAAALPVPAAAEREGPTAVRVATIGNLFVP